MSTALALLGRYWQIAVIGLVLAAVGVQTVRLANERTAHQTTKTAFADERTEAANAATEAIAKAKTEGDRRVTAIAEVVNEQARRAAVAETAAAKSAASASSLRGRANALAVAANTCTVDSAAARQRATDRLTESIGILAESGGKLAATADRAIIRGLAAEGAYDSLTKIGAK